MHLHEVHKVCQVEVVEEGNAAHTPAPEEGNDGSMNPVLAREILSLIGARRPSNLVMRRPLPTQRMIEAKREEI
jgi:hypothetical protein